ncbi:hypothetical protein BSLG_001508 [Batrachochytrium salamandrivorans]|nr:hypothetical protein BSLG_001508 [Batrachochytrium salamandrivorans]
MRQGLDQHLTGLIVGDTTGADTAISNGNNGTTSTLTPTNDLAAAAIGAKNATAKPFLKIVYPTTQLPDRTSNAATTPAYTSTLDRLEMMCSLVDIVPHNLPCHVALINQPNFVDKLAVIQRLGQLFQQSTLSLDVIPCSDSLTRNITSLTLHWSLLNLQKEQRLISIILKMEALASLLEISWPRAFDRGGRIICAGRQLKDAAKITDATTHILTQGSIISDALHSEALLPSCIDKIIELSRWTTDSSGSSVDRQASLYVHEKFKLDSISSSQVRDLFARYWSALANYGEGATPSAATQSQHTPDSHASSDSILSELSHLVDEAVISYILKHHLYKPA